MFSLCYYLSYRNALRQFNENAIERNKELILSLEQNGLILEKDSNEEQVADNNTGEINEVDDVEDETVAVDIIVDTVMPNTQYKLQVYDIKNGNMTEEILPTPSYLIGLKREEVIEYLYEYMNDLPLSEFEKGLESFQLVSFSKDNIVLRKTYNIDKVENQYYLKSQNGYIVVYYGDQKTVYEYTGLSTARLSQYEKLQLESGVFAKNLEELYALLENYSS